MASKVLLSTAYLGPIQYFTKFLLGKEVIIENHETFQKQTYRNRCIIMSANGPIPLVIPVQKGSFHKLPVNKIEIDYTKKWQTNHWCAIEAAYNSTPFFEFYMDDLKPFYEEKIKLLVDFNTQVMKKIFELAGYKCSFSFSRQFISNKENKTAIDYRTTIRPKHLVKDPHFRNLPYHQVFEDRFGFVPNLSILDLLCNMGPDTLSYLKNCIKE